jgi:hypothetical protein
MSNPSLPEIRQKFEQSRDTLYGILDQLGDRGNTPVYNEGLQWDVRQVVCHLADAQRGNLNQMVNIADGKDIIPADFDIERYNRRSTEKGAEKTIEQARAELDTFYANLFAWLEAVQPEQLERSGRHASLNIMTVRDILRLTLLHERGHIRDIAGALGIA